MRELERLNIKVVTVPKDMTHLLQPLDLTSNASVKKMEKRTFNYSFTSSITEIARDAATIEVDLKLSPLKPILAKLLMSIHSFLVIRILFFRPRLNIDYSHRTVISIEH